jgi:DNA polymerase delta subunit 1
VANAAYGFTGASVNALFSRELADSILSTGREYLARLIRTVEEAFPDLKVIYGDTDSVFVEYPEAWGREAVMQHSVEVLTPALNARLPERVRLKHEKVLGPLLLQHIRRYAAYEWKPDGSRRLEMKGMEAVQRNTMPFVVRCMVSTITKVLDTPPAEAHEWAAVKDHVREQVEALMNNKVDISDLTLTRGLWRLGEYDSKQPHVHLVEKIEQTDPRRRFRVGERVAYALVQRESDAPLYKKVEEPFVALQQQLQLDLGEYLKQVRMPMVRLLQLVMPGAAAEGLFQVQFRRAQVGAKTSSPGAITKFFRASHAAQCLRCRATVTQSAHHGRRGGGSGGASGGGSGGSGGRLPLCEKCRAMPGFSLLSLRQAEAEAAVALTSAWAQCAACQRGGRHLPVICTNTSCPVNYKRIKAEREVGEVDRKLAEFEEAI